jgi:hypothetical protein
MLSHSQAIAEVTAEETTRTIRDVQRRLDSWSFKLKIMALVVTYSLVPEDDHTKWYEIMPAIREELGRLESLVSGREEEVARVLESFEARLVILKGIFDR